jgi:hypothetical protein
VSLQQEVASLQHEALVARGRAALARPVEVAEVEVAEVEVAEVAEMVEVAERRGQPTAEVQAATQARQLPNAGPALDRIDVSPPKPTASEAAPTPAPSPMPAPVPVPVPLGTASTVWTSPPPVPAVQPSTMAMPPSPAQSEGSDQKTAEAAWEAAAAAQARLAELEASHAVLEQEHATLTHDYAAAVATMARQAPPAVTASTPEPPPPGAAARRLSPEPETPRAAARRLLSLHPEMSGLAPVRTLTPTHKGPGQRQPTPARQAAPKHVLATAMVEHGRAQPNQGLLLAPVARQGHQVQRIRARQEAEVRARMRGVMAGPPRQHDDLQHHLYSPSKISAETSGAFGTPLLDQMLLSARGQRSRLSDVF